MAVRHPDAGETYVAWKRFFNRAPGRIGNATRLRISAVYRPQNPVDPATPLAPRDIIF